MYRQQRNYENLQNALFDGVGEYGIPRLNPVYECDVENWIGWNYARGCMDPEIHGVHFFVDDYQFNRVWTNPNVYVPLLQKFQAVCTPDFSPYADFPKAIQLYNHYRKHWLGAYWQLQGITVIPTITWSDKSTLEWCFDGEPEGGVVALSSLGMARTKESKRWFLDGYEQMMGRLHPTKILWKGIIFPECERDRGIIQQIPSFVDKWRTIDGKGKA